MNPFYWLELRIRAREKKLWLLLVFFLLILVLATTLIFFSSAQSYLSTRSPSSVGSGLIWTSLFVQFALLLVLSPLSAAAQISQEREQRTIAVIINSPIARVRIVIGKLLASWTFVLWLGVIPLPFIVVGSLWGGPPLWIALACALSNVFLGLTLSSAALGISAYFGRSLSSNLANGAFVFLWTIAVPLFTWLLMIFTDAKIFRDSILPFLGFFHHPVYPLIAFANEEIRHGPELVVSLLFCYATWSLVIILGCFAALRGLKREVY